MKKELVRHSKRINQKQDTYFFLEIHSWVSCRFFKMFDIDWGFLHTCFFLSGGGMRELTHCGGQRYNVSSLTSGVVSSFFAPRFAMRPSAQNSKLLVPAFLFFILFTVFCSAALSDGPRGPVPRSGRSPGPRRGPRSPFPLPRSAGPPRGIAHRRFWLAINPRKTIFPVWGGAGFFWG